MKSPRGLAGSVAFLLAVPVAALCQAAFAGGAEFAIHLAFAIGAVLIASAVGDFKTSAWVRWIGGVSMGALGAIFLLQGVSEVARDDALTRLAYAVLGQRMERWLGYVFLAWCAAAAWSRSRGARRTLGLAAVAFAVSAAVLDVMAPSLLVFVWLAFESATRRAHAATRT
jgi:hypothetical protein